MLYVLAVASVGVYGLVLAGWSSGSTYPLLGGLRSSAQVISYEIAMGLSFVAVFLYSSSMSTSEIVTVSRPALVRDHLAAVLPRSIWSRWSARPTGPPSTCQRPRVSWSGGFHTEYSSLKFALFFLAEYINMFTVAALATTLVPWRMAGTVADRWSDLGRRERRLVAGAVVHRQGLGIHVRLHLAARHAAEAAIRPVHEARVEGTHTDLAALDRRGRDRSCYLRTRRPSIGRTSCSGARIALAVLLS